MEHTYSSIPTPPKIREGLKALVLPDCFSQVIHNNSLPTTLQSLAILNPAYNNSLNSNNIPITLTSLRCNSKNIKLDLSAYESIKELKVDGDSIIHFPPNLESLEIELKCKDEKKDAKVYKFHTVNKHFIKKLVIHTNSDVYVSNILNIGFPNLQSLSTNRLHSIVPTSVQELDIKEIPDICQLEHYVSQNIKEIHLKLNYKMLKEISSTLHGIADNNYTPNHVPMIDNFFKIFRNVYLKSRIVEYIYESTRTPLRYQFERGTGRLDHCDRFPNYNLLVDHPNQFVPALLQFGKAEHIKFTYKEFRNLSQVIPKTIKKLTCVFENGIIPNWITHLSLREVSGLKVGDIPESVTNLTIYNYDGKLDQIPATVKYLSLDYVYPGQSSSMPPSITHLTLLLQTINTLQESYIPSSIHKIEFKSLAIETNPSVSLEIPKHIASRLVNGVFYIYSKSNNKITIPTNTTHLFWLDDHYINNDDILLPPSVHTLVLGKGFNSAILSLPPSITQMVFNGEFKQSLETICFPPGLKYLSFNSVTSNFQEHHLPNGLTHLVIEHGGCPRNLPRSVHHLQFSQCGFFYCDIPPEVRHLRINRITSKLHVPPTFKSLITSSHDRILFDNIYPSLFPDLEKDSIQLSLPFGSDTNIHLHALDSNFNTFIKPYTFGNNIKSISFGDVFNRVIIKGTLPNSVKYLEFGRGFNQKLNKSLLPTSLLTLVLGSDFNQDLADALPSTLTELMLNTKSKPSFTSSSQFPPNLKKLALPCYDGVLDIVPTTINHLEFNRNIAQPEHIIFPIELVPPHITTLVLNDDIRIQSYDLIPASITNITLCDSITPGTKIPCTVESVVLPSSFNRPLDTLFQTVYDDQEILYN